MSVPYLCGGTFLTQVLRAKADRSIKDDYLIGIDGNIHSPFSSWRMAFYHSEQI